MREFKFLVKLCTVSNLVTGCFSCHGCLTMTCLVNDWSNVSPKLKDTVKQRHNNNLFSVCSSILTNVSCSRTFPREMK